MSPGRLERLKEEARFRLEQVAGIDVTAAKTEMLAQVEDEARRDAMILVRDLEIKAREEADRRARRILATAIQRLASEVVTETTVSVVQLPSDDMKGRIIGREGRNIRPLEAVTGANLIVDDTPEAVSVASFDPVRREVARITLEKLVADGRIHPASIEEAYEKAQAEVEQCVRDAGEWALVEAGVSRMHPELVTLLGRLKYRTSYGQNVLNHLVESAHIASMLASRARDRPGAGEARRPAARHRQGSHPRGRGLPRPDRGRDRPALRRGPGRCPRHRGPSQRGRAPDRPGGHRPGGRRRVRGPARCTTGDARGLREASRAAGVPGLGLRRRRAGLRPPGGPRGQGRGRPGQRRRISEASELARRIARKLEEDLQYPGQIQVTVIREFRATDHAR